MADFKSIENLKKLLEAKEQLELDEALKATPEELIKDAPLLASTSAGPLVGLGASLASGPVGEESDMIPEKMNFSNEKDKLMALQELADSYSFRPKQPEAKAVTPVTPTLASRAPASVAPAPLPVPKVEPTPVAADPKQKIMDLLAAYKSSPSDEYNQAKDAQDKIGLLTRLAEASQQIGAGYASTGGAGMIQSDPAFLQNLRKETTPVKDLAAKEELDLKRIKALTDKYKALNPDKTASDLAERRFAEQKRHNSVVEKQRDITEGRLGNVFDWRKTEKDEASDKQATEITKHEDILGLLDMTALAKKEYDASGGDLGKLKTFWENTSGALPGLEMDPKFSKVQQLSGTALVDMIREKSGTAYSVQELATMKQNAPTTDDKDSIFDQKLDIIREIVKKARQRQVDSLSKQGKDPSRFKQSESKVKVVSPDRTKAKQMSQSEAEDFIKKNPSFTIESL